MNYSNYEIMLGNSIFDSIVISKQLKLLIYKNIIEMHYFGIIHFKQLNYFYNISRHYLIISTTFILRLIISLNKSMSLLLSALFNILINY